MTEAALPLLAAQAHEGAGIALAVVAAAGLGALVAGVTRFPKPAGYLVGGALLGPAGLGLVSDRDQIVLAAEIGVALLLFSVGLELSLRELARNLRRALIIGLGQAILVGGFVYAAALALDVPASGALVLASAAGLSSTAAGVALLAGPSGRFASLVTVAVGVLIVQDILAIVIIGSVPALSAGETQVLVTALLGLVAALVGIVAVLPIASGLSGLAMRALARRVDRELFLVATLAAVGGLAAGAALLGLSPALGAFVAGLLVRQSGYGRQALLETGSLRQIFAAVFFVSVGLLFRPGIVGDEPGLVLVLLGGVVVLKFVSIASLARYSGLPWGAGAALGVILANAGEFSFVVVDVADPSVLSESHVSALVFAVVISLLFSSLVAGIGGWRDVRWRPAPQGASVIVGYGRVGRALAVRMRDTADVVVVDRDGDAAGTAQADGLPVIWGDISHRAVVGRLRKPAVIVVTPAGSAGREIVESLARGPVSKSKIVALTVPPRPASLGLDLAVLDFDSRVATDFSELVGDSLAAPFEPFVLRTHAGVVRFGPTRLPSPEGWRERLLQLVAGVGPQPGECRECSGRGRRYAWPLAATCQSCGGTGRGH